MKSFYAAVAIECVGIALVIGCAVAPLPVVSIEVGTAQAVLWDPTIDYTVDVGDRTWYLDGTPDPATPGPQPGDTVVVEYLDLTSDPVVLDVQAEGQIYVTPAGRSYKKTQVSYAPVAGLIAGSLLTVIGLALVVRAARRRGAGAGASAAACAPSPHSGWYHSSALRSDCRRSSRSFSSLRWSGSSPASWRWHPD